MYAYCIWFLFIEIYLASFFFLHAGFEFQSMVLQNMLTVTLSAFVGMVPFTYLSRVWSSSVMVFMTQVFDYNIWRIVCHIRRPT